MINKPFLSICIITYNQEKYIEKCLLGVSSQKLNCEYEIIIGEDKSTDMTLKLCRDYLNKHMDRVRLNENQVNMGMIGNWFSTISEGKGKYIALCEGDDYWIDPYKLQKQVDFLQTNPEYGMVCTDYNKLYMNGLRIVKNCFPEKYVKSGTVKYEDYILDKSSIGTATVLFRRELYNHYITEIGEEQIKRWNIGDTPMWLYFALKSAIKVLPDVTAVYRINENSASRFANVYDKYNFRIKGFEVPLFFKNTFPIDARTAKAIEIGYYRLFLRYRFEAKRRSIGNEEYKKLLDNRANEFDDKVRYYFYWTHTFSRYLLYPIGRIIRKLKKIFTQ